MNHTHRRTFLKSTLVAGSALVLGTTFWPGTVLADWPKAAFEAKTPEEALKNLFANAQMVDSDQISLQVPEVAENGASVPVEISVKLPKVESITIVAEKNPIPLIGQFTFPELGNEEHWVKTRIKMAETSKVVAVVKAEGKLYVARKEVKVTQGGCGS